MSTQNTTEPLESQKIVYPLSWDFRGSVQNPIYQETFNFENHIVLVTLKFESCLYL